MGTPAFEIPPGAIPIVRQTLIQSFPVGIDSYTVPANRRFVLLGCSIGLVSTGGAVSSATLVGNPEFDSTGGRTLLGLTVGANPLDGQSASMTCCIPFAGGAAGAIPIASVLSGGVGIFVIWGYETSSTGPGTAMNVPRIPSGAVPVVGASSTPGSTIYTVAAGRRLILLNWWGNCTSTGAARNVRLAISGTAYDATAARLIDASDKLNLNETFAQSSSGCIEMGSATTTATITADFSTATTGFVGFSGYEMPF